MSDEIKHKITVTLPRELIIDLFDVAVARTREAFELIRDNTDLSGRSARALEGQARFRLMEKGFQDTCEQHGGVRLDGDVIPGTDLRYYQPFMRFGGDKPGVLLGLASMPARSELPTKNRSRLAGVTLNYRLTPRLDLDGTSASPQPGDVFVLLLFARDAGRAGHVDEVAIGVIDAEYAGYLVYESVENFLADYATESALGTEQPSTLVTLKKVRKAFKPPETPEADDAAEAGE
ncbi:hypothetical protein ACI7BZ_15425 [Xanthobacter sp. AM11]|uniref:hypothetical protein n=1 Tax=Xanthobacter sp. AM11 TaxID=3380643 RepID=UPI0039BEF8FA